MRKKRKTKKESLGDVGLLCFLDGRIEPIYPVFGQSIERLAYGTRQLFALKGMHGSVFVFIEQRIKPRGTKKNARRN